MASHQRYNETYVEQNDIIRGPVCAFKNHS